MTHTSPRKGRWRSVHTADIITSLDGSSRFGPSFQGAKQKKATPSVLSFTLSISLE